MDKTIIATLGDFLPDYVLGEICSIHGLDYKKDDTRFTIERKEIVNKIENQTENADIIEQDNTVSVSQAKASSAASEDNTDTNPSVELPSQSQQKNTTEGITPDKKGKEKTTRTIFEFLKNSPGFISSGKLNTATTTRDIRYGIIEAEFKDIGKLPYFIFPVSISQISKLHDLLYDIKSVFKGVDSKNYLPSFLQHGDGYDDIYGVDEKIQLLFILTVNFLKNNGKQLVPEGITYHNFKLPKISPELLKNPNFYKNFLAKDISNIEIFTQSLNNKKTRFLKYYLLELSKNISDNKTVVSKIHFLLTYLKEVKAEKTNINIFQYKDLRNIFVIICEIIEGDIELKKILLENINELYEVWLFQKILYHFNGDDIVERINEKVYFTVTFDELSSYLGKDKAIEYAEGTICPKGNLCAYNKCIYFRDINYMKEHEIEKILDGILNQIDNGETKIQLKKSILNKVYNISEIRKEIETLGKLYGIEEGKVKGIIALLTKNTSILKFRDLDEGKVKLGKSFIKEDNPDFDGFSTIELKNLSDGKYTVSVSFGGFFGAKGNKVPIDKNILEKDLAEVITQQIEHLEDIVKTSNLTPDFVIKIRNNDDNSLAGTIVLDAKFSKYPFFSGNIVDYAPALKYYAELGKYLSTSYKHSKFPHKIIILFPGDKKVDQLKKLNNYFQRLSSVVAVPLMTTGSKDILDDNLNYLEGYIREFISEIEGKNIKNNSAVSC